MLTAQEASEILMVSPQYVTELVKSGAIPGEYRNGCIAIPEKVIDKFKSNHRRQQDCILQELDELANS